MINSVLIKLCLSLVICLVVAWFSAMTVIMLEFSFDYFKIAIPLILITPVFMAPLIEEYGKRISLKNGFPWIYTMMFAGMEYVLYINMLFDQDVPMTSIIVARCLALILHFGTMRIQIRFKEVYDRHGRMGTNWDKLGYYNAVCVHALWNATCVACM